MYHLSRVQEFKVHLAIHKQYYIIIICEKEDIHGSLASLKPLMEQLLFPYWRRVHHCFWRRHIYRGHWAGFIKALDGAITVSLLEESTSLFLESLVWFQPTYRTFIAFLCYVHIPHASTTSWCTEFRRFIFTSHPLVYSRWSMISLLLSWKFRRFLFTNQSQT